MSMIPCWRGAGSCAGSRAGSAEVAAEVADAAGIPCGWCGAAPPEAGPFPAGEDGADVPARGGVWSP
eukprot:14078496-Heterocapsa_arctica.AAC.1